MDALSSISPLPSLHQDLSFETLARRLKKAQACVGSELPLPFPQVLCQSVPLPASLTPNASFFSPLQDLMERLKKQRETCSSDKTVKTLQKAETIYCNFVTEVCQASAAKRAQLMDINVSFVHQLVNCQHTASLQLLVEHQLSNTLGPLHVAAARGDEEMINWLIQAGAKKEARDQEGYTPLHHAILNGQLAAVRQLITQGADPSLTSHKGETPLRLAMRRENDLLILYLLNPAKFKEIPTLEPNGQDQEGFYYQCLEDAHYQGEGIHQLLYLHKLSALYIKKNQWTVAAHLLNNALT